MPFGGRWGDKIVGCLPGSGTVAGISSHNPVATIWGRMLSSHPIDEETEAQEPLYFS